MPKKYQKACGGKPEVGTGSGEQVQMKSRGKKVTNPIQVVAKKGKKESRSLEDSTHRKCCTPAVVSRDIVERKFLKRFTVSEEVISVGQRMNNKNEFLETITASANSQSNLPSHRRILPFPNPRARLTSIPLPRAKSPATR